MKKPSLRDVAYTEMKRMILKGEIRPGEPIPEVSLSESLGLSRTPVREALRQLASEGFVNAMPRRGAFVANMSIGDVRDIFALREVLDCMAVSLATDRIPPEELDRFEALFRELLDGPDDTDTYEMTEIDVEFHQMVHEASGNKWLKEVLGLLLDKSLLIRTISLEFPGRMKGSWLEHLELIKALRAGDRRAAEELARQHVINARDAVLKSVEGR